MLPRLQSLTFRSPEQAVPNCRTDSYELDVDVLEDRIFLSVVNIAAAGATGEEMMTLEIDGQRVQTWQVGGDVASRNFQFFTYETQEVVDPNEVRILYTNDLESPEDRALVVDYVLVDGVQFDPESPTTFSTGTLTDNPDAFLFRQFQSLITPGRVPRYAQSEILDVNGYFQFSNEPPRYGSTILISAVGAENTETMQLWIDGEFQKEWRNIGGSLVPFRGTIQVFAEQYNFRTERRVEVSDVEIRFTNNDQGPDFDRNLYVYSVRVDGRIVETSDTNTFSTGTWNEGIGVVPGFYQQNILHANGSFFYEARPPQSGIIVPVETSRTVSESTGRILFFFQRQQGFDGSVVAQYETTGGSARAGEDYVEVSAPITLNQPFFIGAFVQLIDDNVPEPDESFFIRLADIFGDATYVGPEYLTITILDDD